VRAARQRFLNVDAPVVRQLDERLATYAAH
jgi:hypothetical protein